MRRRSSPKRLLLILMGLALALLLLPGAQTLALRSGVLSGLAPLLTFFRDGSSMTPMAQDRGGDAGPLPATSTVPLGADRRPVSAEQPDAAEFQRMQSELAHLKEQFRQIVENRQAAGQTAATEGRVARIIARPSSGTDPLLGVEGGARQGLRKGAGVLYRGVVVGRVISVGADAACVAPITHRGLSVAARLSDCRLEGVLQGAPTQHLGDAPRCRMRVVARQLQARMGERVVTSGLDGHFPPGLRIGHIERIERISDLEWVLTICPAVDSTRVESVFVLTGEAREIPWPAGMQAAEARR